MLCFPGVKINLGLNIISKRADGFHDIETCLYPVRWTDGLEIIESEDLEFSSTGIHIPGDIDSNLCLKAYKLLKNDFNIPFVKIHLHKIVPIGAGLGGGSSDAACTLVTLNEKFNLGISIPDLENYARKIGSDCAFFIQNKPVFASGKGDEFQPLHVSLKGLHIVLAYPNLHISTAEAYAGIKPKGRSLDLKSVIEWPLIEWKEKMVNDFELSVFENHPILKEYKEKLYECGAIYAAMSGSGSTLFGIFESEFLETSIFNGDWLIHQELVKD